MKKVLVLLSLVMMTLGVVGCGNSPDGDRQKLESALSSLR